MGMRIKIITKFDCTNTGVTGNFKSSRLPLTTLQNVTVTSAEQWHHARNQQRNWEAITQFIGLYTQLLSITSTQYNNSDHTWSFEFETEFEGIFRDGVDDLGLLYSSCDGIPMLVGLSEQPDIGRTLRPRENIWFELKQ
jgi:hypothetical protein